MSEAEKVESFTVIASGETVWRIQAIGTRFLETVDYGRTPAGFRQVIPLVRPLRKGEAVLTVRYADGFEFRHSCKAESGTRVRCGSWTYEPVKGAR